MLESWTKPQLATIFSLAFLEAAWRTAIDLVGVTDVVILPIGALLLSKELLDAAAVGQFLGLLLLGTATFQTLPEVFPERYLDWGNDAVVRGVVSVGVVTAAWFFNSLVGRLAFLSGGSSSPVAAILTLVGVSIAAGLLATEYRVRVIPQTQPFPTYIRYRQLPNSGALERPQLGVIVSRVLLILVFGGMALAVVVRLYPLPELFVIVVTVYEGLSGPATVRSDIAEGFLAGLRAIWAGPRGILGISYGIAALLAVVWLDTAYLTSILNRAEVVSNPVTILFLVGTLGIGTVHAATGLVRLVERLPAEVGDSPPSVDAKPVIPGLLLPAAALFAWFEYVRPVGPQFSYSLTVTTPQLGIALLLAVVAVVPLLRPSLGPRLPLSDYVTIALAPSLGVSVLLLTAAVSGGGLDTPLIGFYGTILFLLSPFLGLELYRLDRYGTSGERFKTIVSKTPLSRVGSPGDRVFDLASEICLAAVVFVVGSILALTFRDAPSVVSIAISTFVYPATAAIVFRTVLIPFYAPETILD